MASNVGQNPYKGPEESRLEQVIADISRTEIEAGANSWRNGSSELAQVRVELTQQATELMQDEVFGEPGRQAAAVFMAIADQVSKHEEGMNAVATAIDLASGALGEAENVMLPTVMPAPDFTGLPDADNVWMREQAKEGPHKASLSQREAQSRKAMQDLDDKLNEVADALREITGVRDPGPKERPPAVRPVTHTPAVPGPGLISQPAPQTGVGLPKDPTVIGPPEIPHQNPPGSNTESTAPHPGASVNPGPSPVGPGTGFLPGPGTTPSTGTGLGVPASTGLAAGVLSTAAVFGGARRAPSVTGLTPGTTPGQIGRSSAPARGNLGRPGLTPGQGATPTRTGASATRGAGRAMAPGQAAAGSRAGAGGRGAGGRGAMPVAGTGGRQGARDKDDRSREALAFEDEQAWLDDDAHGAEVLD